MDNIQLLTAFVRAIEVGSFSAVARELNVSQSTISKQVALLETSLGVQLFARTTRRLNPTPEAQQLYEHIRQLLDALEMVRSASRTQQASPNGTLRITMPTSFGRTRIVPLLPEFLAQYPLVSLDVVLSDKLTDLVEEGFELAIRIGDLPSSSMIARSIGVLDLVVVGTPGYFARTGKPGLPADLTGHNVIVCTATSAVNRWEFESESGRQVVDIAGAIRSNDLDAVYALARMGTGIAAVPDWMAADDLASGAVEAILDDFYLIPLPINIVYPHTRFLSSRARCFIDFAIQALRRTR